MALLSRRTVGHEPARDSRLVNSNAIHLPPRRLGTPTYIALAVIAYVSLVFVDTAVTNKHFGWGVVAQYFFHPSILAGIRLAIVMMIVTMVIGSILGTILAVTYMSRNPIVAGAAWTYIWFFRGTPLLVQIIFWYNIAALFPKIGLSIPFGPSLWSVGANSIITPITAALIALSLNEAAYMAEIIRGGLTGIPHGQTDAARALGMSPRQVLRVIMPQAIRIIIPVTANQVVNAFKNTSLISVIGVADLLYASQLIYSRNYQTIPLLIVASLWYLLVTSILSYIQSRLEHRYGRGFRVK